MAVLTTGNTYANNDQVTAATLNATVNASTFTSGAVDGTTTQLSAGSIIVRDGGITPQKLSTGAPSWTTGGQLTALGPIRSATQFADVRLQNATGVTGQGYRWALDGATTNSLLLQRSTDNFTNASNLLFVNATGSVGIGTITPSSKLQVNGAVTATDFVGEIGATLPSAGSFTTIRSNVADAATAVVFGGTNNAIRFGHTSLGSLIEGVDAATAVTSFEPLFLGGSTLGFQTNATERMTIDANGDVGIGVSSPEGALELRRPDGTATQFSLTQENQALWWFRVPSSIGALAIGQGTGTGTEFMRFTNAGNVGIGTTTPSTELEVDGTVKATLFDGPVSNGSITAAALESGSNGQLFIGNGTGFQKATLTAGSNVTITNGAGSITISASGGGGGGGTVTSVAVDGNDGISVSGSPITSSGTIDLSLGDITPDTVDVGAGGYKVSGTKVLGAQAAAEADVAATVSLIGSDTVDITATLQAINALEIKINALLAKLRTHGIIAT
jgi:hypothetical protein